MTTDLNSIFLQSLGWALVHSIWQITVVALLLAFLLPRLKNARRRYWWAFSALFSAFAFFASTFLWVFISKAHLQTADGMANETGPLNILPQAGTLISGAATGYGEWVSRWLEDHAWGVVAFWVAGFSISIFRLLGGLYYLHRLQRVNVRPALDCWQQKVDTMRKQLGLVQPVSLLESGLVRSPLAWGYLKPLIFFPIGLVNQLSAAEVESILAHELAHIARRDWLFNLFQSFVEAIFYFHPAIWWISSVVCTERENCCDDTAVLLTGDRFTLAKALLHLQQLHPAPSVSTLALGAQGRKKRFHRFSLLSRIQRILNQPSQQKSLIMEKFVATALLLGVLTLIGVRANGVARLEAANNALAETAFAWFGGQPDIAPPSALDSVPKPPHRIQKMVREDNGKRVEMDLKDGQMTRLNIDGRDIPANEWSTHQALTNDVLRDMETAPPPVPTTPGMPPMPPMPTMPSSGQFNTPMPVIAPMPPMPPMNPHRISTSKDAQGNTLIHLERAGEPVEITVKDGEVWVGDQRVKEGESVELAEPDEWQEHFSADDQGNYVIHSDNGDVMVYHNEEQNPHIKMSPEVQVEMELIRKQAAERKFISEKDQRKQEKALQKAEKEMRKAEQEMQKQQLKLEEKYREMKLQEEARMRQMERKSQ